MEQEDLKIKVDEAISYVMPLCGQESFRTPDITTDNLPKNYYSTLNTRTSENPSLIILDIDQISRDCPRKDAIPDIVEMRIAEEIGQDIFLNQLELQFPNNDAPLEMLTYVTTTVGHYIGLIYVNRNYKMKDFGIGIDLDGPVGRAYKAADEIFIKYEGEKLKELISNPSLLETLTKIYSLRGGKFNDRAN